MRTCTNCGEPLAPNAKFCNNCGVEYVLPAAGPETRGQVPRASYAGERKFVTILFADISGFTALNERFDPEYVRGVVNATFDHLVPIVEKHQGVVDQFVGDALVALFGAPFAHEDDPEQACRAALEMLEAVAAANAQRGTDLGVHMGINSGPVLAGGIGSRGRQQYSVVGDAINLAARLDDAAERGEIFVGPETYQLTASLFDYIDRGEFVFKGKAAPVQIHQLLGEKVGAARRRGVAGLASPMLGRDREFGTLKRLTDELRSARGTLRVVSIIGEAGLGKSRLIEEWREWVFETNQLDVAQVRFIEGHCQPHDVTSAYHLVADLLRAWLGLVTNGSEQEAHAALQRELAGLEAADSSAALLFPYLAQLLGLELAPGDAERVKYSDAPELQAQYANALRRVWTAPRAPTIIVCEDLHWADAQSVELLRRLLPTLVEAPLLFCFVTRLERDTLGWSLIETANDLPGGGMIQFHLAALSDPDTEKMVAHLLAHAELPAAVRKLILSKAEGNPFFVEEVIRILMDRGDLVLREGHWILTREVQAIDVPSTVQGVLMARVDQLPADTRRVLQVAAVIGREFPLQVLTRVMERQEGRAGPI